MKRREEMEKAKKVIRGYWDYYKSTVAMGDSRLINSARSDWAVSVDVLAEYLDCSTEEYLELIES